MTTDLVKAVPQPALVFGLAGTLPYLGTSLSTLFLAREASRASQGGFCSLTPNPQPPTPNPQASI